MELGVALRAWPSTSRLGHVPACRPRVLAKSATRPHHSVACVSLRDNGTHIKVCGVMSPSDARHATSAGASLIGMIMWPPAKRALTAEQAALVVEAAREGGAEPVGVFVDEDAATIASVATEVGLKVVQLHGPKSQAALGEIPAHLEVVFVVTVAADGSLLTEVPNPLPRPVDLFLIDSAKSSGASHVLDWSTLPPKGLPSGVPWLLAGGLTVENVHDAISTARPDGVDVSSGVCGPDGLAKDLDKVAAFVNNAAATFSQRNFRGA